VSYSFSQLAPEYTALLTRMVITRVTATTEAANRLIGYIDAGRYAAGCNATGVPQIWAAACFEREASSNFNLNAAQGWPLHQKSQWVPQNGPFATWTESQIAAYQIDGVSKVGAGNWTWELMAYYGEKFNGFGPREHGIHTGYDWAGSNNYSHGKYIADGVWSGGTVDQQLGIVPMMYRMVQLRPSLDLQNPFPTSALPPPPTQTPGALDDVRNLQTALNKLGYQPALNVDGSYGRLTTAAVKWFQQANGLDVDGLSGQKTWAAIQNKLKL
jgi:lysozyme family protein